MAIFSNNNEVTDLYLGDKHISVVYKDFKVVYTAFSRIWKDRNIWKDNAVWKS